MCCVVYAVAMLCPGDGISQPSLSSSFTFSVPFPDVPEHKIGTQPSLVLRTLSTMCIVTERPKCQYCISDPPFVSLSPEC